MLCTNALVFFEMLKASTPVYGSILLINYEKTQKSWFGRITEFKKLERSLKVFLPPFRVCSAKLLLSSSCIKECAGQIALKCAS